MSEGCVFCDRSWMRAAEIFIETPHCIFTSTRDPDIRARAGLAEGWNQGGTMHPHQRPGKQTARPMGARERTGTPACQVSETPRARFRAGSYPD